VTSRSKLEQAIAAFRLGDLESARTAVQREIDAGASAGAFHLLGLIECRSGRIEAGVKWLTRALEAEPANLSIRVMLARAFVDSGRAAEGLEVARVPAGASPSELALWEVRAEAATGAQAWDEAVEAWTLLATARPGDWRALANAGTAFMALGRHAEAAAAFEGAAGLNPTDPSLRRSLAIVLGRAGQFGRGVEEMMRLVELWPGSVADRVLLSRMLADLGRSDEFQIHLDAAAKLVGAARFDDSRQVMAAIVSSSGAADLAVIRELGQLLERTNRMDALATLLEVAESLGILRSKIGYPAAAAALRSGRPEEAEQLLLSEPPDSNPIRWHGLMARIADALDDPQRAFDEAGRMHRSVADHDGWRARAQRHVAAVGQLSQTITRDWATGLSAVPRGSRSSPAFLVGFPRSGTTLLDTFLMGHPDVQVLEEEPLLDRALASLGDVANLPARSPAELLSAREAYFAALDRHLPPGFGGLVVDKLPLNLLATPLIHCLFPDAPIVFAQRHPCDVVLSCFMQAFALNDSMACFLDLETAANFYDAAMTVWLNSRECLPLRSHTCVYESLIIDPEAVLQPLIAFLQLEWQDRLLDHQSTARNRPSISTPSYHQVTRPLTQAPSGRWRRYQRQLEPALPRLTSWATRLGYPTDLGKTPNVR
jgi:Flp pilus assembly protein TadD